MDYVYLLLISLAIVLVLHFINVWFIQPAKHKPAVMSQTPKAKLTEENHLALIKLGSLLSRNDSGVRQELELFVNDKAAYFEQFADDLDERGITQDSQVEPVIALIDALMRAEKVGYHDWKAEPLDVLDDLNDLSDNMLEQSASYPDLLKTFEETNYGICEFLDEVTEQQNTASLFTCATEQGLKLLGIDEGSDAYALILVAETDFPEIVTSAKEARIHMLFTDV